MDTREHSGPEIRFQQQVLDSQAALKAISAYVISFKLTWICSESLKRAACGKKLTLLRVPEMRT